MSGLAEPIADDWMDADTAVLLPQHKNREGSATIGARRRLIFVPVLATLAALVACHFSWPAGRLAVSTDEVLMVAAASKGANKTAPLKKQVLTDKATSDPRNYSFAVLPNGLQVLNIRDKQSLKAAFAVAVRAGSYDDPEDLPGLAHFCEHMLFLGTKKFPKPSGFDKFMSKSGGSDNAYTAREVTVYFAELSAAASTEGLDRFADFFRAPLFDKRFVEKEVHAIDSEHAKNVQSPFRRIYEVMNSLANPRSPVSRFFTGDKGTLYDAPKKNGSNPVDALRVYFEKRYCPLMMRVVTFGPSPLDEQLRAASGAFASIKRGGAACANNSRNFSEPEPWPAERKRKWLTVKGTQPQAQLWIQWFLPDVVNDFLSLPLNYIDYLFGYRGVNSLSRVLEDSLGLAASCEVYIDGASTGTSFFFIVTLTERGAHHHKLVIDVVFAYLAQVAHAGVDKQLYQTIADIAQLQWDWGEPADASSAVSDLAERMTRLPPEHMLSGDECIRKPNPEKVAALLKMFTPRNMNVAFVNPNATNETLFKGLRVQTLPHYGVDFAVQELSDVLQDTTKAWESWLKREETISDIQAKLASKVQAAKVIPESVLLPVLPRPIKDVPKQIARDHMKAKRVDPEAEGGPTAVLFGPRPRRINATEASPRSLRANAPHSRTGIVQGKRQAAEKNSSLRLQAPEIWYRSGWVTTSPKVTIQMLFRPLRLQDEPEESPFNTVLLEVYGRLLGEEMAPEMVDLTATGVDYRIGASQRGLSFSFGGFAPVLPRLVDTVLSAFNRFNGNSSLTAHSRFARIMEELREEYTTYSGMPVMYAMNDISVLLGDGRHSRKELLQALGNVSLESAAKSAGELLLSQPLQLTALAMGNLAEGEALAVINNISTGLQLPLGLSPSPLQRQGHVEYVTRVVNLTTPVEVRARNPRPGDPNDAVVVTLIVGVETVEGKVELSLLSRILSALAYDELRTSRQLGYVVNAFSSALSNVQYVSAMVQGTVLRADDVEAAIELVFTELMPKRLRNISEEEFATYVDSLRQNLLEPPTGASHEVDHFWSPVVEGGHCFELRDAMLQYLNSSHVTLQRLADIWDDLSAPRDGMRGRLVVKYFHGDVRPRPTLSEARKSWEKQGLGKEAMKLLSHEFNRTLVLDRADSENRARLVQEGGYFPQDLFCSLHGG